MLHGSALLRHSGTAALLRLLLLSSALRESLCELARITPDTLWFDEKKVAHHPNKGLKGHNFGEKVVKKVTKNCEVGQNFVYNGISGPLRFLPAGSEVFLNSQFGCC